MVKSSVLVFPLFLMLTSCAGQDRSRQSSAAVSIEVPAWAGELPIAEPWLRERLPAGTLAYQRVPNLLALLAMPKGNLFDAALGSEANVRNFLNLQDALAAQLTDEASALNDPIIGLLLDHLSSPVELAVIGLPQVSGLVGLTLDLESRAELEALFAELSQRAQLPGLVGSLDSRGFGQLAAPLPILLHFEEATGRLTLYGGPMATQTAFAELLAAPAPTDAHPMRALERQIDESGQGLFGWVDTTQALALGALFIPPEAMQILRVTGLDQLRAVAFGAGVADGKGRLKLIADVGSNNAERLIPVVDNRITASSVGEPRSLFVLSIPGPAEFARLENAAFANFPPEIRAQWDALKAEFAAAAGASIEEVLGAIGPELISFADRAGSYSGIKLRDPELFDDVLARIAARAEIVIEERRMGGQRIRHVALPAAFGPPATDNATPVTPYLNALARMRTRLFWVEEGDYLYVAGMPQLLMDRASLRPDTSIATWLAEAQHVDLSSAVIGATGTVANLPGTLYQFYLGMMQALADVTEAEFDLWSMPSASQLALPERGTLGFSLNLGEPYLSLEFSFESHPAEILLAGGGAVAVAAAGAAAAIALPAYQDYLIRAQVSQGLNLAAAAKAAGAEAYYRVGAMPANRAAANLPPDAAATSGAYVAGIDIDNGHIVVRYGNAAHPQISGSTLVIEPYRTASDEVVWICGYAAPAPDLEPLGGAAAPASTIEPKYLPSACR